uniref:Uncharacterized protein n=1 Tax=Lactuca sativa TaxID=4236 RepID=A0A9R1UDS3_LACSA|nr:hypothetical protein LSAT_V11C900456650 [Lactuca sativa]
MQLILEADGWNLRVCGNAMYLNIYGVLKEIYRKVENNELGRKRYQTLGGGFDHCGMSRKTKTGGVVVQKRLIGVTRYKKDVWFEVSNTTHHQLNRIHYLKPGGPSGYLGFEGFMYCRSHFGQLFKKTATLRKALKIECGMHMIIIGRAPLIFFLSVDVSFSDLLPPRNPNEAAPLRKTLSVSEDLLKL